MPPTAEDIEKLLAARRTGRTLRQAAAEIGRHVSTVCRWQLADHGFALSLEQARRMAYHHRQAACSRRRPRVPVHPSCPCCGSPVLIRGAFGAFRGGSRFWRCSRWPSCRWASWRPRHPQDCPDCGRPCYWSDSRKSVVCSACGRRVFVMAGPVGSSCSQGGGPVGATS